jgi:hypothetical protein
MRTIRMIVRVFLFTSLPLSCQKNHSAPSAPLQGRCAAVREFQVQASDVSLHVRMAGNPDPGCVPIAINGGPV